MPTAGASSPSCAARTHNIQGHARSRRSSCCQTEPVCAATPRSSVSTKKHIADRHHHHHHTANSRSSPVSSASTAGRLKPPMEEDCTCRTYAGKGPRARRGWHPRTQPHKTAPTAPCYRTLTRYSTTACLHALVTRPSCSRLIKPLATHTGRHSGRQAGTQVDRCFLSHYVVSCLSAKNVQYVLCLVLGPVPCKRSIGR